MDDVKRLIDIGVEKVILNTAAVRNPRLVASAAEFVGGHGVAVSIDAKQGLIGGYQVMLGSGTQKTGLGPATHARNAEEMGAGEILINSIDRDGTLAGYDIALVRSITSAVSVSVVAWCWKSGGVLWFTGRGAASGCSAR